MTQDQDEGGEKAHDPSPRKLEEARKKGDMPRSADVYSAVSIASFVLALLVVGEWAINRIGLAGMVVLDQSDQFTSLMRNNATPTSGGLLVAFLLPVLALLAIPPAVVLAVSVAMRSLRFTPHNIAPRLSRISPLALARHKFGAEGLIEFTKSTIKLLLVSMVLYLFIMARLEVILGSLHLAPSISAVLLARLTIEFLLIVVLISVVLGAVDYLWQVRLHRQRNRMSHKELMDEFKESEGDPHIKSARRQKAQSVATSRMLADVATADVVVVNPTHYAVALKWDRAAGGAPVCVAKGVDEIAAVIRARAAEHGVPIHRDPPTARAIHATVELGMQVRAEHYRAVAAAIRFSDVMRKRAQRR